MRALASLLLCSLACACAGLPKTAIVDGQVVPRKRLEFSGSPYQITHRAAHPRPGGPSSGLRDAGGNITGMVCGMDVDYDVKHEGDHLQLIGFLDQTEPSQLQVREGRGVRQITGNLARLEVNLTLTSTALEGQVGLRTYKLQLDGGALKGPMVTLGTDPTDATLNNRDELWRLPPADQAVVLATILTCYTANIGQLGRSPLVVGFGGPAGNQPRGSSTLYGGDRAQTSSIHSRR